MRRALASALLLVSPALLSATDPLTAARADAASAEREQQRLARLINSADGSQNRLQAEQAAAAQAILAAEAEVAVADLQAAAAERRVGAVRASLDREQRPAALLLAGLAQYGRRPPLLTLASGASVADLVHLRALTETILPVVAARSQGLRRQLDTLQALSAQAAAARTAAATRQQDLKVRQQRFASLESQLNRRISELGGAALGASDVAMAQVAASDDAAARALAAQQGRRTAGDLAALEAAPPRPFAASAAPPPAPFAWVLPLTGPILSGLGEISASGVRARGLTIGSRPGAPVVMPAAGTIVFAGPFRRHLSVVVLDHGGGWMTLLTEVRTSLPRGTRLAAGAPLGRTLGDVAVELSRDGRPQPAALIAGSSPLLSKGDQPS